jgi:hypothetical protein
VAAEPADRGGEGLHRERAESRRRASLNRAALSQPGATANPLFGLAHGNPVDPDAAYEGNYDQFGTRNDPMVGHRVGGTITFGGGLALYSARDIVGGLGLAGDTACADHSTAWRLRTNLRLAPPRQDDRMTLNDTSGHPHCPNDGGTQGATR